MTGGKPEKTPETFCSRWPGAFTEAPGLEQGTVGSHSPLPPSQVFLLKGCRAGGFTAQHTMRWFRFKIRSQEPLTLGFLRFSRMPPSHTSCLPPHRSQLSTPATSEHRPRLHGQFHSLALPAPHPEHLPPLLEITLPHAQLRCHQSFPCTQSTSLGPVLPSALTSPPTRFSSAGLTCRPLHLPPALIPGRGGCPTVCVD